MSIFRDIHERLRARALEQQRIRSGLKDGTLVRYGSDAWIERQFDESGLPEEYRSRWLTNPYWSQYRQYYGDIGHGLGEMFDSFWSGSSANERNARKYEERALAYQNDLISEYEQNNYNSEEQKSKRMMAAGQNPNLLGTNGVADDVGNPEPLTDVPLEGPGSSAMNAVGSLVTCVSSIMSFSSSFVSLLQGFQSLKGLKLANEGVQLDNEIKDVQKFGSIRDLADSVALYSITEDDYKPKQEGLDIDFPSTLAKEYADKYFPSSKDYRKTKMRDAFLSAFSDSRTSILNKYKTYDSYLAYRKGLQDPAQTQYEYFGLVQQALIEADFWDSQVRSAVSSFKSAIMTDEGFQNLLKKKEFADLYASISKDFLETTQANVDMQELDIESEVLTENRSDVKESLKQRFLAEVEKYIAIKAQAVLDQTTLEIKSQYFEDYLKNGSKADFKYRPLSPARRVYDEASGGSNIDDHMFNAIGSSVENFINFLAL